MIPSFESRKIDPDTLGASVSIAGKKRKSLTMSSRGVANLTPEQLAKKRANDREAQRAIRKRTKAQIEALERRVQELTSQQPYQDLQTALQQRQAVLAENDEIRRRLSSVVAIIQPILDTSNLTGNGVPSASCGICQRCPF
jgi:hypothetical protein